MEPWVSDVSCGEGFQFSTNMWTQNQFSNIEQLTNKTFVNFIGRLKNTQIHKQIEDLSLHSTLLLELAKTDANQVCRDRILGMPFNLPPTLSEIIEMCTKKTLLYWHPETENNYP